MNGFLCPSCANTKSARVLSYKGSAPGFTSKVILQCSECNLYSMHPLPEDAELKKYYQTYWSSWDEADLMPMFEAQATARFAFLEPLLPEADVLRILDVGAGYGLIKKAFRRPVEYDVVEVDPQAVAYLETNVQPRTIFADGEDIHETYDMIILSHILEHMKAPREFLESQLKLLCVGGLLFVEVPNKDFLFKARNEPHLLFFACDSLWTAVQNAGYEILKIETCGQRIGEMQPAPGRARRLIRSALKGILPQSFVRRIRSARGRQSSADFRSQVSQYGGERRWIRLVAVKR